MKKKMFTVISVSLFISLFIEILIWLFSPAKMNFELSNDAINLYPGEKYYTEGYDIVGSQFIPSNDDPQLGFLLNGIECENIYICYEKPLEQDTPGRVYYAIGEENLSEENAISFDPAKNSTSSLVKLPPNVYTHIRLDLDAPFYLESIYVSPSEEVVNYEKPLLDIANAERALITTIIISLCCISILYIFPLLRSLIRKNIKRITVMFDPRNDPLFLKNSRRNEGVICFKFYNEWIKGVCSELKKHRIILLVVICIILVLLQTNNSNMRSYDAILRNNIASTETVSLGVNRPIRSDEFFCNTPTHFHNAKIRKHLSSENHDNRGVITWLNDWISSINPYYWGDLFLPAAYSFSWNFVLQMLFSIFVFFRLFYIITKNTHFAILASLLIAYSPGVQWWWGPIRYGMICGIIVFFHDFFCADTAWKKLGYAWGILCCVSAFIPTIYPAGDIPVIYLFFFILVGIFMTNGKLVIHRSDIPYICVTSMLILIVVAAYFISGNDVVQLMLETIYPGKRFDAGGGLKLKSSYWGHYLVSPFITWKPFSLSPNQSEISSFLHFFPLPFLVYLVKFKDFKKNWVMHFLVLFSLVSGIYMMFGVGEFVAKYTLLSYSTSVRMSTVFGFSTFVLMLLEVYFITPSSIFSKSRREIIQCVLVDTMMAIWLIWFMVEHEDIRSYIGPISSAYFIVAIIILGTITVMGKKKIFFLAMIFLTVISGVIVNPINFGCKMITDTPLAKEIEGIDRIDPGRWIALDDIFMPKYVYAQGVDCLNYVSWPPRFDLFEPLDETKSFYDIYNRYAHVMIHLNIDKPEERTSFSLLDTDQFLINMNAYDLKKWDVKYVVAQHELPQVVSDIGFQLHYYDSMDNVYIYKVTNMSG